MKFTKDTMRQLIAEEIENYLNEQGDDEPLRASPEKIKRALAKLVAMGGDEDLGDTYTPLPAGPEKEFPGTPKGIPGFEPDDDDDAEAPLTPTQEVPYLARTPIGRKPRRSPETRIINKK
tara:strand:+ start:1239 stop:1598 length:360 start_codon:yes stop_codon:yes gene_type:complete